MGRCEQEGRRKRKGDIRSGDSEGDAAKRDLYYEQSGKEWKGVNASENAPVVMSKCAVGVLAPRHD